MSKITMSEATPVIFVIALMVGFVILMSAIGAFYLGPSIVVDRDVTPSTHALYGIVAVIPPGNETYCINAETLSRGEPVIIGVHYRVPKEPPVDRFSEPVYIQDGKTFTTDNNRVVNETITIPKGAIDSIITVSYSYYMGENKVHIKVRKC
jgi:hypothetical protein